MKSVCTCILTAAVVGEEVGVLHAEVQAHVAAAATHDREWAVVRKISEGSEPDSLCQPYRFSSVFVSDNSFLSRHT